MLDPSGGASVEHSHSGGLLDPLGLARAHTGGLQPRGVSIQLHSWPCALLPSLWLSLRCIRQEASAPRRCCTALLPVGKLTRARMHAHTHTHTCTRHTHTHSLSLWRRPSTGAHRARMATSAQLSCLFFPPQRTLRSLTLTYTHSLFLLCLFSLSLSVSSTHARRVQERSFLSCRELTSGRGRQLSMFPSLCVWSGRGVRCRGRGAAT